MFSTNKTLTKSTALTVAEPVTSTVLAVNVNDVEQEEKIVGSVNSALKSFKCLSPSDVFTLHNALLSITTANSFASYALSPSECQQDERSAVMSCVNVLVGQVAQLSKLYLNYATVRDMQAQFINAIPYGYVESCFAVKNKEVVILEGKLNAESLTKFIRENHNVTVSLIGDLSFNLRYNGIFQARTAPTIGLLFSAVSTAALLCQNLSADVNATIEGYGHPVSQAVGIAPNIPFITVAGALEKIFSNQIINLCEAAAQVVVCSAKQNKMEELSEEMLEFLTHFVSKEQMLENRKILNALKDGDIERFGRTARLKS